MNLYYFALALLYGAFIGVLSMILLARGDGWFIAFGQWNSSSGPFFIRERWYGFRIGSWHPFVRVRFRYWIRTDQHRILLAHELRGLRDIQGVHGTWNHSPYQQGMYNGLEIGLALLEQRAADLKDPPSQWLCDIDQDPDNNTIEQAIVISLTAQDGYATSHIDVQPT